MKQEVLIALLQSAAEKAVQDHIDDHPILRGRQGPKGLAGESFDMETHRDSVVSDLNEIFNQQVDNIKLKFSDLTNEEAVTLQGPVGPRGKAGRNGVDFVFDEHADTIDGNLREYVNSLVDSLKLKLSDLSEDEVSSIRGPQGVAGKEGIFVLENHAEYIQSAIRDEVQALSGDLKLKLKDLTDDEIASIRGPRGQKGQRGASFSFDEHREAIEDILHKHKIKFEDLTEAEVEAIMGPQGKDGKDGKDFTYDDHREAIEATLDAQKIKFDDFTPEQVSALSLHFSDLTDEQAEALRGPKGHKGVRGESGQDGQIGDIGPEGPTGKEGPEGLRGPRGQKGSKGLKGETGQEGQIGDIGPEGPTGSMGPKGHKGVRGESGQDGQIGDIGPEGPTGKEGPEGLRGPRGQKGSKGLKGETGQEGQIGDRGPIGPMGPMGLVGLTGSKGERGHQGQDGIHGYNGLNAPKVVDVLIRQPKKDRFYFVFVYDDGSRIETPQVKIPAIEKSIVQYIASGGAALDSDTAKYLVVDRICVEDIAKDKFVAAVSGTEIALAQNDEESKSVVLGLALSDGLAGNGIKVLMFGNHISNIFAGLLLNKGFYLGKDGGILNAMPENGYRVRLGSSNGDNSGFLKIEEPIKI